MRKLKKLWDALNGNKTTIWMIIVLDSKGVKVYAPTFLKPEQLQFIETTGMIIGGGGLIHKGVKNDTFNKAMNSIKSNKSDGISK
jgi:hypothetical protein